jgi:hypothetical protein
VYGGEFLEMNFKNKRTVRYRCRLSLISTKYFLGHYLRLVPTIRHISDCPQLALHMQNRYTLIILRLLHFPSAYVGLVLLCIVGIEVGRLNRTLTVDRFLDLGSPHPLLFAL